MVHTLPPITFSKEGINNAAKHLLQQVADLRIFAFSGNLGAGKTTFINALCKQLGVNDHVSSPTFSLINEYRFEKDGLTNVIYHMDWYRLRDADEAINAGMEDCLHQPNVYCFIEWPEQAPELLSMPHAFITLEAIDEESRLLTAELR